MFRPSEFDSSLSNPKLPVIITDLHQFLENHWDLEGMHDSLKFQATEKRVKREDDSESMNKSQIILAARPEEENKIRFRCFTCMEGAQK